MYELHEFNDLLYADFHRYFQVIKYQDARQKAKRDGRYWRMHGQPDDYAYLSNEQDDVYPSSLHVIFDWNLCVRYALARLNQHLPTHSPQLVLSRN